MRYIVCLIVMLLSMQLKAEVDFTAEAVPSNLHVYSENGSTFVDVAPHGCSGVRYYIPGNHPRFDHIVSMLMAAQLSDTKVVVRFDGCNTNNQGRLIGVYLK